MMMIVMMMMMIMNPFIISIKYRKILIFDDDIKSIDG